MKFRFGIAASVLCFVNLLTTVNGLKCSNHEILKKYQLDTVSSLNEVQKDTPPSKTTEKWWINVCEENNANVNIPSVCNTRDILCGITEVTVEGKDALITQVIDFTDSVAFNVEESDDNRLYLTLKAAKWGSNTIDAIIDFTCNNNMKMDEVASSSWFDNEISLSLRGPSGCLKTSSGNPNNGNDNNDESNGNNEKPVETPKKNGGLSWFTWLVIYALLFTFIYLLITSYMSTRGAGAEDFRLEFIERSKQLIVSLPEFCKEVIGKIFGSRGDSQRGGYSAV